MQAGAEQAQSKLLVPQGSRKYLGGGDDHKLIILARDDNGALRLQVEVLLAAHAYPPLHHMGALLPGSIHVPAHDVVPRTLWENSKGFAAAAGIRCMRPP